MKTKIFTIVMCIIFVLYGTTYTQVVIQRVSLNNNNIAAYFQNTGIFNQNTTVSNSPGFEWPKGSNKFAFFTAGLSIGCGINGQYAQSMASYKGEFAPGYVIAGVPWTSANFKFYSIKRGDNAGNNPDYANWGLMIPYGAPYIDVNNNGQYDPGTDSIGIRNAAQVIFVCMTDGFPVNHNTGEGFGGGITTPLMFSEIAWTAWCYDRPGLGDIQFMKWVVINKGTARWDSTFFSLVGDPDLGDSNDDYIGCDTSKKLGYCYNADNNDPQYGANPPAVGIILHKSPLGLTSFNFFTNTSSAPPPCEADPNGEPIPAYNMMQGLKKDRTPYMDVSAMPHKRTKFVYTGDPETDAGWTEYKGSMQNCGDTTGPLVFVNPSGDRRFILSSGSVNRVMNPFDTVIIVASQLIARGSSNKNSVTQLKNYANTAWAVYNGGFNVGIGKISENIPSSYSLNQNYPNPFNPTTNIRYSIPKNGFVKLVIFDMLGRETETLVSERQSPGTYEVSFNGAGYTSGIYFYNLTADGYSGTKKMILIK